MILFVGVFCFDPQKGDELVQRRDFILLFPPSCIFRFVNLFYDPLLFIYFHWNTKERKKELW